MAPVQISDRVVLEVLEGHSHSDRAALAAGRMDSTGSMVADTALAWKALASVCVHEHRAHPEQN
ncbi:hypothetical protein [Roseburia sp. AM59-24XD]|uniref:hypothetical protein n=1 Tax=Roseburia sp. AM59-24XD TaxID=2293138 RepID=UPI0013141520|nr:hypothetical protein [Roseburia sp. AM59-24XD]